MRRSTFFQLGLSSGLLVVLLAGAGDPGLAREYNRRQGLPPAQQAKVERAMAHSWMMRGQTGEADPLTSGKDIVNTGCGPLTIGQIKNPKKAPREQIIVTGDVINVARNCGSRR